MNIRFLKNKKALTAGTLCALILFASPLSVSAGVPHGKEEVVTAELSSAGDVRKVTIINTLFPLGGSVTDYGDYEKVSDLSGVGTPKVTGDAVTVDTELSIYRYSGETKTNEIPWDVNVSYTLDGIRTDPSSLPGKSGALVIDILVTKSDRKDSFFYDNYLLSCTVKLPLSRCGYPAAEGASVLTTAQEYSVTKSVLPGKGLSLSIETEVNDFEMDGVEITASDFSFDTGELNGTGTEDIENELDALGKMGTDTTDDPESGVDAAGFRDGAKKLDDGAGEFIAGADAIAEAADTLADAAGTIAMGTQAMETGVAEVVDTLASQLLPVETRWQEIKDLVNKLDPESRSKVEPAINDLDSILQKLFVISDRSVDLLDGAAALNDANQQLSEGLSEFAGKASELKDGAAALKSGTGELYQKTGELEKALSDYAEQLIDSRRQITEKVGTLREKVDEAKEQQTVTLPGKHEVKSFASEKNDSVSGVTFVLTTEEIRSDTTENSGQEFLSEHRYLPETYSLWDRILIFFGIKKTNA